ncbi:glycerophosphoryl diester phosphodiesterase [Novosphingobium sp. Rr 2-17]|uniref:glycerophosphodiester phosphodiesterase family protein n=1 Tax=Novosphingobium sp. Rr 2-17 TaxID=555793 RepID=UPI000269823F|nr:glycerophosphodiester phosphodiesterase family protein [Novosphingobium sp. Rr 2-17]EIZ78272.1 glycerophosphoryl diester phosphodiesterase [Novosphingobium sp. Rr 2-17]
MLCAPIDHWLAPAPDPRKVAWLGERGYAHRGLHDGGIPENSRAAVIQAMAAGWGVEIDVRRSSDGQPIVFHDDTLDRLTAETGLVARRSAAQLGMIGLAGTSQTIPTLRLILAEIAGRVPVLIEIKSDRDARIPAICLAVRRVLEGYIGRHAVMSFDPRVARWYAKHSPHTVRGLIVSEAEDRSAWARLRRRLALWHARPDFLACDVRDLPSGFASTQRRRGLPIVTWTVRTSEQHERAAIHADAEIFEGPELIECPSRDEMGRRKNGPCDIGRA